MKKLFPKEKRTTMLIICIQDILLGILVAMILIHRYVPVDVSSLLQYLFIGLVYSLTHFASLYVKILRIFYWFI